MRAKINGRRYCATCADSGRTKISYETCHGLMHNALIIPADTAKDLNARARARECARGRRKVTVDFHVALLRVIGYCIRSVEFRDTAHVNETCVRAFTQVPILRPTLSISLALFPPDLFRSHVFRPRCIFPGTDVWRYVSGIRGTHVYVEFVSRDCYVCVWKIYKSVFLNVCNKAA